MDMSVVVYGWNLRQCFLEREANFSGMQSTVPRTRKFLLFTDDGRFMLVAGPCYSWPMEYHHFRLRDAFSRDGDGNVRCLGGGALLAERDSDGAFSVRLTFWKNCVCGRYNGELAGLEEEFGILLGCRVAVAVE